MRSSELIIGYGIAFVVLLFATANLLGIEALWGINLLSFFPKAWSVVVIVATALLLFPVTGRKLATILDQVSERFSLSKAPSSLLLIISLAGLFALFLVFHSAMPLLGDGSLRANEIHDGRMWQPTEMLDFFLHAVLYQYVFAPLGYKVTICYRIVSALSGVLFVIGLFRLALYMRPSQFITVFLVMLSSGMTVLFFGYVESYSIVASFLPWLILSGLKVIDNKGHWISLLSWYILSACTHSIAGIIFGPALLVAMCSATGVPSLSPGRVSRYLLIIVALGVAVLYTCQLLSVPHIEGLILPLIASKQHPQAIVTFGHWLNLLNWLLLSGAAFLSLLPGVFFRLKERDKVSLARRTYAAWIIVPSFLFLLLFVPQLGGARDWDLFSLPAFLLIPASLLLYSGVQRRQLPYQLLAIIVISLSNTFAFAAINSSVQTSVHRFSEVIEVQKFRNLYLEYASLFNQSKNHEELRDRQLEFALKAWEQPPRTKADTLYMSAQIARLMIASGDKKQARRFISSSMTTDSLGLTGYLLMREYLVRFGDQIDLVKLAQRIERTFPENPRGQMEAGVMYLKLDRRDDGGRCLERAYASDSSDSLILVNYGNYLILNGKFQLALKVFWRAVGLYTNQFDANFGLATAQWYSGQNSEAIKTLSAAERLAKSTREREKVAQLRTQLNGSD